MHNPECTHRFVTEARNVTAAIGPDGALCGEERRRFFRVAPLLYAVLRFCSNRGCEQVFHSERV